LPPDLSPREIGLLLPLAAACLLLGLYPKPFMDTLQGPVNSLANTVNSAHERAMRFHERGGRAMTGPVLAQTMFQKVHDLWPEIAMFITTCIVMVVGLSPSFQVRRLCSLISALGLGAAGALAAVATPDGHGLMPNLMPFAKVMVAAVGLLLLFLAEGTVDRQEEHLIAQGRLAFNPLRTNRAEFYAFFLFSLTGVMLCASADDLVWLFLALELTSLPTYIMVTISQTGRAGSRSQEAGVKYFFLGALGAATFLYGFALLYGGTGTTDLNEMRSFFSGHGFNGIALTGMLLSLIGVGFKIAAVPMHLYTPDVYEGAAAPVSAFLAFTPKTAGFLAILLLCSTVGWGPDGHALPDAVRLTLWVMAALTMTVGNVLALWQNSVKRILAYSSIAHSGYMLVGVIAGPGDGTSIGHNGPAAVLFYLLCYGVMNMGCFAVLACLERKHGAEEPHEIETVDDLSGLCKTHPALGWTMVLCSLSLMGFPPLLGFLGKLPLFTSIIAADDITLAVVLGLNSAIAAYYYLRLAWASYLQEPLPGVRAHATPFFSRPLAATVSAIGVLLLVLVGNALMKTSKPGREPGTAAAGRLPRRIRALTSGRGRGGVLLPAPAARLHGKAQDRGHDPDREPDHRPLHQVPAAGRIKGPQQPDGAAQGDRGAEERRRDRRGARGRKEGEEESKEAGAQARHGEHDLVVLGLGLPLRLEVLGVVVHESADALGDRADSLIDDALGRVLEVVRRLGRGLGALGRRGARRWGAGSGARR
jgi:NADH-quinone oxidoreductase subunit N